MELSFIVWNTQRKELYQEVTNLCYQYDANFIVLIESKADSNQLIAQLAAKTGKQYFYHANQLLFKNGHLYSTFAAADIVTLYDHKRYTIKEIKGPTFLFNLIIVHLPAKNNVGNPDDRDAMCATLIKDIDFIEAQYKHTRSIVVGDFNMNPYDNGIVSANGLHSVMDRGIAKTKSRSIYNKKFEYFYNPMWSFFGDHGKGTVNGTHYFNTSNYSNYFWNIYDQVLVRPDLLDNFEDTDLAIIDNINGVSLTKIIGETTRVDTTISDHLPLKFKLKF